MLSTLLLMHETVAQAKAICDQKEGYSQTLLPSEVSTFTTSSITALLISYKKCEAQEERFMS